MELRVGDSVTIKKEATNDFLYVGGGQKLCLGMTGNIIFVDKNDDSFLVSVLIEGYPVERWWSQDSLDPLEITK